MNQCLMLGNHAPLLLVLLYSSFRFFLFFQIPILSLKADKRGRIEIVMDINSEKNIASRQT